MKKTSSRLGQKGTSQIILLIAVITVLAGGAFYLYLKTRTELKQAQVPHQDVLEEPAQRGGGAIKDMDIPIYPGSRKIEEVGMGPDAKGFTYMVKAEPKDVAYFYVDELKKLGFDTSREAVDQQLFYTSMDNEPQALIGDEKQFVQIAGKKDKNGEVAYAIMIMASR